MKTIKESIWGDLARRSGGIDVRKEDDVNNFDIEEFYAYVKKQYKTKVEYIDLDAMGGGNGDVLGVDITEDIILFYKPKRGHILLSWSRVKIPMPFFDELTDRFKVENPNAMRRIITEKDGSCTNRTFISVINFFLSHKQVLLNESIWGDLARRSGGTQVRAEDELPQGEQQALATYIDMFASIAFNGDYTVGSYPDFRSFVKDFKNNIKIENIDFDMDVLLQYVKTNWDNVVLPTILDTVKKIDDDIDVAVDNIIDTLRNSKMNESIWGDLARRSGGTQLRAENSIDTYEPDDFVAYIRKIYKFDNSPYDIENYKNGLGGTGTSYIFIPICTAGTKSIKLMAIDFEYDEGVVYTHSSIKKYIPKLWANLDQDFDLWDDDPDYKGFTIINPKDTSRKVNNSYVLELLDYICDNLDDTVTPCIFRRTNESLWGDLARRSGGKQLRGEDDIDNLDLESLCDYLHKIYKCTDDIDIDYKDGYINATLYVDQDGYIRYLFYDGTTVTTQYDVVKNTDCVSEIKDKYTTSVFKNDFDILSIDIYPKDRARVPVTNKFFIGVLDFILEKVHAPLEKQIEKRINESIWGDLARRSGGEQLRAEDEELSDMEINSLNEFTLMYCRKERAHYIQNNTIPPPPSGRKENDYEGLIKYIEDRRDENKFINVGDYNKIIRYIKKNWDKLDMDKYIKKHIFSPTLMNGKKLVECEGVPGGLTPADVGGMGAAYFPGPNGEPGSGDLPSPTGVVYHQVAPYTMFLKGMKKKKKKKKFRIEDEPCAHSKNSKTYDYVDDFREYVDRTYNNIDRRK